MKWQDIKKFPILVVILILSIFLINSFHNQTGKEKTEQPKTEYKATEDNYIYYYYNLSNPEKIYMRDDSGKFIEVKDYGKR